jgi:hypothetical protein
MTDAATGRACLNSRVFSDSSGAALQLVATEVVPSITIFHGPQQVPSVAQTIRQLVEKCRFLDGSYLFPAAYRAVVLNLRPIVREKARDPNRYDAATMLEFLMVTHR